MSDLKSLQLRITKLEELLSNQEHFVQQLNEVIVELQSQQDAIAVKHRREIARLEALIGDRATPFDPDEKPPHY